MIHKYCTLKSPALPFKNVFINKIFARMLLQNLRNPESTIKMNITHHILFIHSLSWILVSWWCLTNLCRTSYINFTLSLPYKFNTTRGFISSPDSIGEQPLNTKAIVYHVEADWNHRLEADWNHWLEAD